MARVHLGIPRQRHVSLPPLYVPWAFFAGALGLAGVGLAMMFARQGTARLAGRLQLSDGVAGWLAFAAVFNSAKLLFRPDGAGSADLPALWTLWAMIAAYAALRLPRIARGRDALLLALALTAWGWMIGAGYQHLEDMQAHAQLLRENPAGALAGGPAGRGALRDALLMDSLEERQRDLIRDLTGNSAEGEPLPEARLVAARYVLLPELETHYQRYLIRLHTYQAIQIVLLAAVLLAWGFGTRPDGDRGRK